MFRYYSLVIPEVEADEELKMRSLEGALTPDRYYYLLTQVGISESEAETARANLLLQQTQKKSWQK